jgi:hypothetical protein
MMETKILQDIKAGKKTLAMKQRARKSKNIIPVF